MACKKRSYKNKKAARYARLHTQSSNGGIAMETYRCKLCGDWHNGHPKGTPPERKGRKYEQLHVVTPGDD